jgi:anthranilate phosphoribosyltransferase
MDLEQARALVAEPAGMSEEQAEAFVELLLTGSLRPEDGGALLVALAERGEQAAEVAGFVRVLQRRSVRVDLPHPAMDVCGTGGSGLERFNVSTCVAFVAAACGVPIAKHGNRGSRKANGSFDVLEALGVAIDLSPAALQRCFEVCGLCFLFARSHHPAMKAVVPYRQVAARRTIFNLAGPLSNPAPLAARIIGTINAGVAGVMAGALERLDARRSLVLRGEPGIDEASITGMTDWWWVDGLRSSSGSLTAPLHPELDYASLPAGDATANAATMLRLLSGEELGPLRNMVVLNAALAIDCWEGRLPAVGGPGQIQAEAALGSGAARERFTRYRDLSKSLA